MAAPAPGKKLIELGWDTPDAAYVRDNIDAISQRPFDGIAFTVDTFTVDSGMRGKPSLSFDARAWTAEEMDFDTLAAIERGRLDSNFVAMWHQAPDGGAWFDDARWSTIEANMRLMSRAVSVSGARGVTLDPEFYQSDLSNSPWTYNATKYQGVNFTEVEAKVRQRGAQFMTALQSEKADIAVLNLQLLSGVYVDAKDFGGDHSQATYALLPAFVNGMLDTAGPAVDIIDGHEHGYSYESTDRYEGVETWVRDLGATLVVPEHRERYKQGVVGMAVSSDWTLGLWGPYVNCEGGLSDADKSKWLEHNTYHALRTADEFAWLYNESFDLVGPRPPSTVAVADAAAGPTLPLLLNAVREGRAKAQAGEPLGFDITC